MGTTIVGVLPPGGTWELTPGEAVAHVSGVVFTRSIGYGDLGFGDDWKTTLPTVVGVVARLRVKVPTMANLEQSVDNSEFVQINFYGLCKLCTFVGFSR